MFIQRIPPLFLLCLGMGCATGVATQTLDVAKERSVAQEAEPRATAGAANASTPELLSRALTSATHEAATERAQTAALSPAASPRRLPFVPGAEVAPAAFVQLVEPPAIPESLLRPVPEQALGPELTKEQLEARALAANPSLAAAWARVQQARGRWVQVGLPPNTVLGYSAQQLGSQGEAEQQGVFIGQEFVRGNKLVLSRAVAAREVQKAEQVWAAQRQRVLTDVRLAYYEALAAQRRIETAQQIVDIATQAMETAEALLRAQEVSQVDVMRARVELKTAELLHANTRNHYDAAWTRLSAVVGDPQMRPQPLSGNLEQTVDELDANEVLDRLVRESPEMAAAISEIERARWAVDRACAEPIPNVEVQAVLQRDIGTGSSNGNLQVTLPIPWLNRNQGGIREARAAVVAAERAADQLELSFQERLATVYQRYANARNQVDRYAQDGGILATSKATLNPVRQGCQAGELGCLGLLTAQRTYSQTHLAYIEALSELWAATVEIEGLLLKGSLETRARR